MLLVGGIAGVRGWVGFSPCVLRGGGSHGQIKVQFCRPVSSRMAAVASSGTIIGR